MDVLYVGINLCISSQENGKLPHLMADHNFPPAEIKTSNTFPSQAFEITIFHFLHNVLFLKKEGEN